MTQYNTLNVKLSHLNLIKLKLGIKNATEITLQLSSNVAGYSNDENSFLHKLVLNNAQVAMRYKAFGNGPSAYTKLSKRHLHKTGQSEGFLGRLSGPLLRAKFALSKNVLKPLAESVLIPIGFSARMSNFK